MTGGTRKRGSTWSYYFDLGKVNGKRQKKEKGGSKTKKEAEAALAKAINEYNNAGAPRWRSISFTAGSCRRLRRAAIRKRLSA